MLTETVIEPIKPTEIPYAEADISERYEDVFWEIRPDSLAGFSQEGNRFLFTAKNGAAVSVQVLGEGLVRVRFAPEGIFEADFSYAIDPKFAPAKTEISTKEGEDFIEIQVGELGIQVAVEGLTIRFYDMMSGRTISEDIEPMFAKRTIVRGICEVKSTKKTWRKEAFFGLGDKTCGTNLRGQNYHNWCSDSFAFGRETDENYRAIPFYLAYNQGLAYGIFLDNTFRSGFDFDSTESGKTVFGADGGELNYYFFYEKTLMDIARKYTDLTGRAELPPIWALGYHQSRWSYFPEKNVLALADEMRRQEIPCDAIYLDIDYMDGWRCFTVNGAHFPDLGKLTTDLEAQNFKTVVMIDPGIKADAGYSVFKEGVEKGHFLKKSDGQLALAPVWPGLCAFPDFTKNKTRLWWGELYREFYEKSGVAGFWNDMNEPAVFHVNKKTLPDDILHDFDGHPTNHRKAHNVYGQQMSRASVDGLRKILPEKRPFLLSRATFSGGQRDAAVWTGDNVASWDHLQLANIQCQRLAVSGFSFVGSDIGGFIGAPDGELMVRWLQLAAFHPFMRTHYSGDHLLGDAADISEKDLEELHGDKLMEFSHEPFSFGEKWTPHAKKAIELRYHILPTIYSAFRKYTLDGTPILRHLFFEDPMDAKLLENERDFMFGEHLLVSPVIQPKLQRQSVYLPQKSNWYYFWSGQPARGGSDFFASLQPEQIPFFVREGAVLPIWPTRNSTSDKPIDELTLYVYHKIGTETSQLYEDSGEGYAYNDGDCNTKTFTVEGAVDRLKLTQTIEGKYAPTYLKLTVYLVGLPFFVKKCKADKQELIVKEIRLRDRSIYKLELAPGFGSVEIT